MNNNVSTIAECDYEAKFSISFNFETLMNGIIDSWLNKEN